MELFQQGIVCRCRDGDMNGEGRRSSMKRPKMWPLDCHRVRGIAGLPSIQELSLASTFIGAVVGAGFASGKEIFIFFSSLGPRSILASLLSTVLFMVAGAIILDLSAFSRPRNLYDFLVAVLGKRHATVWNVAMLIFVYGGLTIMIAGGGAVASIENAAAQDIGIMTTAGIICFIVLLGAKGLLLSNLIMVPVMLIAIIVISIRVLSATRAGIAATSAPSVSSIGWITSAIIYTSYNLVLSIGTFASLSDDIRDSRSAYRAGILGGLGIGLLIGMVNHAVLSDAHCGLESEMPMLALAGRVGKIYGKTYQGILFLALISSGTAAAYTLGKQLSRYLGSPANLLAVEVTLLAIPISRLGFTTLLEHIYPFIGSAGVPLICAIIARHIIITASPFWVFRIRRK